MAYTGILTTEAEIDSFSGENVDATGDTEANHNTWVAQAEAYLFALARYNFVTNYATLTANLKALLSEYCARYAAVAAISYNMAGYTTRIEAEDMINVHLARMEKIEKLILDQKVVKEITG